MPNKRPLPKDAVLIPKTAKRVFAGKIFELYQWRQKLYDGSSSTFEMLKRADTVVVIGIVDGNVVLEEQEQPSKPKHFTLPAGRIDPGETPLAAARREMHEETGMTFGKWELKAVNQLHNKFEWFVYTFVAQDLINREPQRLEAGERIKISAVPFARIVKLVKQGEMHWSQFLVQKILNGKEQLEDIINAPNFREAS